MKKTPTITLLAITILTKIPIGNCGGLKQNDAWPQWRGPERNSKISESKWPSDISENHLTKSWTVPLGPSYSGPIVASDRVFVTETKDKKTEVVRALDKSTGEQLWETSWEGSMRVPFFAAENGSWIRATPAFDGERLFVAGIRDVLVCLDSQSGDILWKLDFMKSTASALPKFGCASSPLIFGDWVFIQAGGGFAKIDKKTGKIIWQTLKDGGGMSGSAFSSPVQATIFGIPQLIVQTRTKLAGVDQESGDVLWSIKIPAFRGMNILTPTIIDNAIFTSSYGGRSTLFELTFENTKWNIEETWNHKSQGYMSSPVVIDGHIFLHLRNRRFVCLDAKSGQERWTTKPFGKYWSMIANNEKLLVLDQNGELLFVDASPDAFKLLDRRKVANDSWAHLAVVGNQLFVRDIESMMVFDWQ